MPKILNKEKIFKSICDDYQMGKFSLESICKKHKITKPTFFTWAKRKDFAVIYQKSKDVLNSFDESFLKLNARNSLLKLIEGFDYKEVQTFKEKGEIVSEKITTKKVLPNVTAVIFALKNLDKENFGDGIDSTNININSSSNLSFSDELKDKLLLDLKALKERIKGE